MTSSPGAPEGWEVTTLGEQFRWGSGGTPKRTETRFYGGDIPWAVIGDLNGGVVTSTRDSLTQAGLENSAAKWIELGSVLVAMYGSIGKLGIAGLRMTCNQAIAFADPDGVPSKYLFYYLQHVRPHLISAGKGGTQPNISQEVLKRVPFLLAPPKVQESLVDKVEELFSDLDAGVAALERAKVNLARYRAAVLKAAVEGRLTERWRRENPDVEPASESSETPEAARLPPLPDTWRWTRIGQAGRVVTGSTPSTKVRAYYGGGIPFFKPTDLNAGYSVTSARDTLTDLGASKARILPAFTPLVTCIGTMGKAGLTRVPGATNQQINAVVVTEPVIGKWLYWCFVSPWGQRQIRSNASATTLSILNKGKFSALFMPLPPRVEMVQIVTELERVEAFSEAVQSVLETAVGRSSGLRHSILGKAFAGELT